MMMITKLRCSSMGVKETMRGMKTDRARRK
jgi:hypothetical protein